MKIFYDIECYKNFFCCGFVDENKHLEMHYLVNNEADALEVKRACEDYSKNHNYTYTLYDLSNDTSRLKYHMKKHIPTPEGGSLLADFLEIEEEPFQPKENVYFAYNNLAYDIPMLDYLISSIVGNRVQASTTQLRRYSDSLINSKSRKLNTSDYERYANQVDVAMLNEKMVDSGRITIGLKTIVGMKGGSIIESESNYTGVSENIYEDTIYNINDIVELKDVVFPGELETVYNVRASLLERYPYLAEKGITPNSTSAKFVEYIIAPDEPINDYPVVSYKYPAEHIAKELGVEPFDMLEYTKEWYLENVYKEVSKHSLEKALVHLTKFMSIYYFYKSFEGKNWNDSSRHFFIHGIEPIPKEERRKLLESYGTYLPFIDRYGNYSYTHVNFSSGGIHGAEINKKLFEKDKQIIAHLHKKYKYISKIPKTEKVPQQLMNIIKFQSRSNFGGYPQSLMHEIPELVHLTKPIDDILHPDDFTPYQYDAKTKSEKMHTRYKYTSSGYCVHQDFAGYYPVLLINMGAFYNGSDNDRYRDVYNHRISIKSKLKDLKYGSREWFLTNVEQEGYKLVLNAASGVLDGSFDTNLRANNKALSMRIIGQLITFIIGSALSIEGAIIPSSNTDGIYVFNIDDELNDAILKRELSKLHVTIDPEHCYIVSKDTNNRIGAKRSQVSNYSNIVSDIVA